MKELKVTFKDNKREVNIGIIEDPSVFDGIKVEKDDVVFDKELCSFVHALASIMETIDVLGYNLDEVSIKCRNLENKDVEISIKGEIKENK